MKHILSLGAGVQSSTLALMAAAGEVEPMPDCAIFADTGWEPAAVYEWLDWLEPRLPFPVRRVMKSNIREDNVTARMRGAGGPEGHRWTSMPYFTVDRETGSPGMVRRQCTTEYKIAPIDRAIRAELGLSKGQRWPAGRVVTRWFGISLDEIQRMKVEVDPRDKWAINRYPLVERRMTRHDCLTWMERQGFPEPPRSACIGCPYHSNAEWRAMRDERPDEWADAVAFDNAIREAGGMRGNTFLHADRIPLEMVDLSTAEDAGQLSLLDECEGMCGV